MVCVRGGRGVRSSAVFQAVGAFGWRTYARDRGVQQTEEDVRFFEAFWRHAGPLRTPARRAGAAQLATCAVRSAGQAQGVASRRAACRRAFTCRRAAGEMSSDETRSRIGALTCRRVQARRGGRRRRGT